MGNILPRHQRLRIRSFPRTISTLLWTSWVPHTGGMLRDPVPGTDGTLRYRYRAGADQIPRRHPPAGCWTTCWTRGSRSKMSTLSCSRISTATRRMEPVGGQGAQLPESSVSRAPRRLGVLQQDGKHESADAAGDPASEPRPDGTDIRRNDDHVGTTYPTPGHTPGHTGILISSNGQRAIVTATSRTTPPR